MAKITKNINLDVSQLNVFNYIIAKQDDTASRFLRITLMDEGVKINIDPSSTVTLNAEKPDGKHTSNFGVVNEDGTVTVGLTNQTLAADGLVKCDVSVIDTEGRKLTSTLFSVQVEHAAVSEGTIVSSDEFGILDSKANLVNDKVPASELPNNIVHNGLTGTAPILETPTIDPDGITLSFSNPHNLTVGQTIIIDENGGVIPIGIREKFSSSTKFSQLLDKRLYSVFTVPTPTTIQVGTTAALGMGTSTIVPLNSSIIPVGNAFSTSASQYCVQKDSLGNIYVAFVDGTTSPSYKVTVKKFDGTTWSVVGAAGFTSQSTGYLSFAIASDNTLWIAYRDMSSKCIVMKFDGTNWVTVGSSLPTTGSASFVSLAVFGTTPYVVYQDSNQSSKCVVMKYDGSSWVPVGTNPISADSASYIKMKIASNGNIYVAYSDGSAGNKATVKMYDGSTWSTVGTVGFTTSYVTVMSLSISSDNTPYIAYPDNSVMDNMHCKVMKYSGGVWINVGSAFPLSTMIDITISSDGTIYATHSKLMKLYMSKYTGGAWQPEVFVSSNTSNIGLLINDEYHLCGQYVTNSNYILGKLSAIDNGSGAWKVANLVPRYDIENLDFNNDGGTYEIDIKGLLLQKTASSLLYLAVNDLNTSIYYSPYNSSSFGSTMYSLLAIASTINDITLKLTLKRMSNDTIMVEVSSSILSSFVYNYTTGNPNNSCFVGYIKGAGIENITKLSLIATGCPILNECPIIVRRVLNNAECI